MTAGIADDDQEPWRVPFFGRANYIHDVGMNDVWSVPQTVNYDDPVSVHPQTA